MLESQTSKKQTFTLLTGRTIYQGVGKEYGKMSEDYFKSVAICEIDPNDLEELGIKANDNIKITTKFGSVVVRAVESLRAPHPKSVFMPYGAWANLVIESKTDGTGMPSYKGIPVTIESTRDNVLTLRELLKKCYRKVKL